MKIRIKEIYEKTNIRIIGIFREFYDNLTENKLLIIDYFLLFLLHIPVKY